MTRLQSGDLTGAQTAFSALTQDTSTISRHKQPSRAEPQASKPIFGALGQALQSGDLASAKTDFAKLQQDLQSVHGHHHHHHRQSSGAENSPGNSVTDLLQTTSSGSNNIGSGLFICWWDPINITA